MIRHAWEKKMQKTTILAGLLAVSALPAAALETTAALAFGNDSAASLEELQPGAASRTAQDDTVRQFEFGLYGEPIDGLSLSYDFADEAYDAHPANNSATHSVGLRAERNMAAFAAGLGVDAMTMQLDGEDYLDMRIVSPSLSYLGDAVYLSAGISATEKDFVGNDDYDAEADSLNGLAIFFFNRFKSNVGLSLSQSAEDAEADTHDFNESKISLSVTHKTGRNKIRLSAEQRSRDYDKVTDTTLRSREDRDWLRATLTRQMLEDVSLQLDYDYKDRTANIVDATYDSSFVGLRLIYRR